jgi:hypothetical protein
VRAAPCSWPNTRIPCDSSLPSLRALADDFDSDPENRRKLPNFYGYLPDEGNARTIMYVCMVLNSAILLLLRSIGAALLMLADTKIFVAYMAGDHLLYLLQKLVRGDFLHWLPFKGVGGLAWALLERVIVKTLTDFTGVIQFRAAGEMGGVMWLWTMCLALVAPWVAVPVYFGSLTSNLTNSTAVEIVDAWELEQSNALGLLGGLTAGWVRARTKRAPTPTCFSAPLCGRYHMCDLAGRRGGSGVSPRQPEILPASATGDPPRARSCTPYSAHSIRAPGFRLRGVPQLDEEEVP